MEKKKETVFVPIKFESYRVNKIKGLKVQLLIKKSLLLIEQIKETKKLKNTYITQLNKKLKETKKEIENFKDRLPNGNNSVEKKIIIVSSKTSSNKIDGELKEIQKKLKELSA